MSDPVFRPLSLGDTQDDDGEVFDSLVQQEANAPAPPVDPVNVATYPQPTAPTRLFSVRIPLSVGWSPVLVFPADLSRVFFHARVSIPEGSTATGVVLTDNAGTVSGSAVLTVDSQGIDIPGHTGAVWATALGDSGETIFLDAWSVTR